MKKNEFRGVPAPFHAAVVFAVALSVLGSPLARGIGYPGVIHDIIVGLQALFYDTSEYPGIQKSDEMKSDNQGKKKGGRGLTVFDADGTTDPPPPPPPPPR